jgi:hypothetical protein
MRRVLQYDGLLPMVFGENGQAKQAAPADVREMAAYIAQHRLATTPFDIIVEGVTPGDRPDEAAAVLRPWTEAGATWWIESMWGENSMPTLDAVRQRVAQGPPHLK